MMKVAYLMGALRRGGTETLMFDVFKNAENADFQFIGIHRKGGEYEEEFYATEQKMYKLAPRFPFDWKYIKNLKKIFIDENIQIAHAQQALDTFYAWLASRRTAVKVILTFHGFDNFKKKNKLISFLAKRTDRNFFVSNYQKEYYTKKYGLKKERQATVYNGISFEKLDAQKDTIPIFEDGYKGLLFGSVGNFVVTRSQIVICRFLKLLAEKKDLDFRFVFAGLRLESQAYLYDECVKFCKENNLTDKVFFLGGRKDIPNILKQLDAFVYSSAHDTFGIAVVEAMAAKTPVFVNDWAVMREIASDGEFATVFKSNDEKDLFNKFYDFITNIEHYRLKAERANLYVRENFSIKKHLLSLHENYVSVLEN